MNKILNLKLFYKGKLLDIAKYKRDFEKKFYIGKDKHIFWQILDDSFPEKHKFLEKKGKKYQINLLSNMDIDIKKDDKELDRSFLRKHKILNNKKLFIDPRTEGRITLAPDWSVEYTFNKKRMIRLTPREREIVKRYAKYEPLSGQKKFTVVFLFLALLFSIVGTYIFQRNYTPPNIVETIEEKIRMRENMATEITIPETVTQERQTVVESDEGIEETTEQEDKEDVVADDSFAGISLDNYQIDDNDQEEEEAALLAVTKTQVLSVPGSGTGSGTGQTSSEGRSRGTGSSIDESFGTGEEIDISSSDVASLSEFSDSDFDISGETGLEGLEEVKLTKDIQKKEIKKISTKAELRQYAKKVNIKKSVKAADIDLKTSSTEGATTDVGLDNQFRALNPRIQKIYDEMRWIQEMYGTLVINVVILENGKVDNVYIDPTRNSKFTEKFLNRVQKEILTWKLHVDSGVLYEYTLTFISG